MPGNIVVIGSTSTEVVIEMEHFPVPGESIVGRSFSTAPGGRGANQAVAAARAGGQVALIARVGNDMFGLQALEGFIKENIRVDYILRDEVSPSGVAFLFVAANGDLSTAMASGANGHLSSADVEKTRSAMVGTAVLVTQLEIPLTTVKAAVDLAYSLGIKVIMNPAPARPLGDHMLKRIAIITPNRKEAAMLTGIKVKNPETACEAAEILVSKGVGVAVVTLGSKGAWVASADVSQHVPGFCVKVVDTRGAGDVFSGALAVAIAEGKPILDAVRFANAAAALSVSRPGAQRSAAHRGEIDQFLKRRRRNLGGKRVLLGKL